MREYKVGDLVVYIRNSIHYTHILYKAIGKIIRIEKPSALRYLIKFKEGSIWCDKKEFISWNSLKFKKYLNK